MYKLLAKTDKQRAVRVLVLTSKEMAWLRFAAMCLSGFGFFIAVFTLTPFQGEQVGGAAGGNIVNAIGYSSLGAIYLCVMLMLMDRRLLTRVLPVSWLLVFAIAFWSCFQTPDPVSSMRGLMLTLCSMILVVGILLLPRSERDFINAGANAILALLLINYMALLLIPHISIHSAAGLEAIHAGSWRGHVSHKNVAAPVFSMLAIFGIYCWRSGAKYRGIAIFLLSTIFVLQTNSKTTAVFFPLAVGVVFLSRLFGRPALTITVHLLLTVIIGCLTIGTVFSPRLQAITSSLTSDPTFTGRDSIWDFGLQFLPERFWSGYGYYGFWQSQLVTEAERDFEAAWDVRGIVSGHNAYLDAFLMFGIPCGLIIIFLLIVKPLFDYIKAYRRPENWALADFFLMIVVFMTYDGMLETFLLNRSDAMWLLFALGSYGMIIISQKGNLWKS